MITNALDNVTLQAVFGGDTRGHEPLEKEKEIEIGFVSIDKIRKEKNDSLP